MNTFYLSSLLFKQWRYYLGIILLLTFSSQVLAQTDLIVKGHIRSSSGELLPGALVQVKGTSIATSSNTDGYFLLDVKSKSVVLTVSFIGFKTREVTLTLPHVKDVVITLEEDAKQLKEVEVLSTGYQYVPRERSTGSFSYADNQLLNRRVSTDVLSKIEGVTSGVLFNKSPGGETSISVRGKSTLYANDQPLIVLDKFPYEGDINAINPNDIESITVLKDAAAASIWGVRAGNGVIVITTKKGAAKKALEVEFNSNFTLGEKPSLNYLPWMSSSDFIEKEVTLFNQDYYLSDEQSSLYPALTPVVELMINRREGKIGQKDFESQLANFRNQDLRKDLSDYYYRNSSAQQYALNFKGAGENASYYLSAGYDNNQSSKVGDGYQRYSLRSYITLNPMKGLDVTGELSYTNENRIQNNSGTGINTIPTTGKLLYPYARLIDKDGTPVAVAASYRQSFIDQAFNQGFLNWEYKPIEDLSQYNNQTNQSDVRFNTGLSYKILPVLSAELAYQYQRVEGKAENLMQSESYITRDLINRYSSIASDGSILRPVPYGDILDLSNSILQSHTGRLQLNFAKNWNNQHNLVMLLGTELKQLSSSGNISRQYGYDDQILTSIPVDYVSFFSQYPDVNYYQTIINPATVSSRLDRFGSLYSNLSYTLYNKYTLSASGRVDKSNYFGVRGNQQQVPLYSFGLGWSIDQESFFQNYWINHLKLRATYGSNGNIDKSLTAFTTASFFINPITGTQQGRIINPPNPDLKWEKVRMVNIGVDFASRKQTLSGRLEFYWKEGTDLIGLMPTPPSSGVMSFKGNVAGIEGRGVDAEMNVRIMDKQFKWYSNAIFSSYFDKVSSYQEQSDPMLIAQAADNQVVPVLGRSLYGVYAYKFAGLDHQSGAPLGYNNGQISTDYAAILANSNNMVFMGPARPSYYGGFRNSFTYKGFSLSANITFKAGYVFRRSSINYQRLFVNDLGHSDFALRWKKSGDEAFTTVPSMPLAAELSGSRENFYTYSDILVEDASHIRLQDISLSYLIDRKLLPSMPIAGLQIYGYVNNLGLLWKANKSGIDPDRIPDNANMFEPQPRTYSVGIKATF